ncbi:MAG: protease SohB [Pseudomonadota bacterium]|uniref:protease SohB n=1 Tax=Halomonas sp. IOP_31 TaxID=2876584 RepID=UPI001E32C156|nr:protease SohB [Halomonas sp. IOP_31]MEA3251822.1 protease SohB [Pseudomonadota bacterium]
MSQWFAEYGLFLAQLVTLGVMILAVLAIAGRAKAGQARSQLRIEELDKRYRARQRQLRLVGLDKKRRKAALKAFKRDDKRRDKRDGAKRPTLWVLDFHGDIKASGTARLAEEVSLILGVIDERDEVAIRLESPGGLVHAYGLAAAQLDRLRDAGVSTTVCIDKVAASGGYMMACCADRLRAAPFAVLGSIGVVAQLPNIHRLLKRHDVDVELLTAGRYKRTLTVLGENTEEGREKFIEELESTHALFKRFVAERRQGLDIDAIATGETWYGSQAVDKGLIDAVGTSEAYLLERMNDARVVTVSLEKRRRLTERLGRAVSLGIEDGLQRIYEALEASGWQRR